MELDNFALPNKSVKSIKFHIMINRYLSAALLTLALSQGTVMGTDVPAPPISGTYILYGNSMFDFSAGTNAYLSGGVPLEYSVKVTLDAESELATMDGLLGTRTPYEPVTGKFDPQKRTISFPTPLEEINNPDDFIALDTPTDYHTLLCALKPYGIGYIDTLDGLLFVFSDDGRTLYPSSGFGAGATYQIADNLYAVSDFLEMIYDAVLVRKEAGVSFNIDHRKADIANSFPGIEVKSTFRIYNTGDEPSDFVVASESPMFVVSNPAGILAPGDYADIELKFLSETAGNYLTKITVTNEDTDITFDVSAVCNDLPEYARIVNEGEFNFSTDVDYPWILSDNYGATTVAVCTNSGHEMTHSSLYADIMVSEKHAGILSWSGHCDPFHPVRDAFGVLVDGEERYVSPDGGGSTSSRLRIAPGFHRLEFAYVKGPIVNGSFAQGEDYAWITDISLVEEEIDAHAFIASDERVSFKPKTIVRGVASDSYQVSFMNEGYEDLIFLEAISDNDAFSAELPTDPTATFDISTINVLFHASLPGKHSGSIRVRTNAGDFVIRCSGEAVAVPDFSPIVSKGEFYFDTTIAYPFTVEDGKAFNSTSQKKDRKATSSILVAYFDVPEGYYGELTWKARVSCAGTPGKEMTDYATVYIDGEDNTIQYYGEELSSHTDFAPAVVNLFPGEHFVAFAFSQAGDSKYEGDDRIEVSDLALDIKKMKDNDVMIWGDDEIRFEEVRISKAYNRVIKLTNTGAAPLQIKSVSTTDRFLVDIDPTRLYNTFEEVPVSVSFIPEKAGVFEEDVILETSAGQVKFRCSASVVDDAKTILTEDFEDDLRLWKFIDADGDEATWAMVMMAGNAFHGEGAIQSFSIHSDFSEGPIDDIALTPEFRVPSKGAELSFWLACFNTSVADKLDILAGEGEDYESYTKVETFDLLNAPSYYNEYNCSLEEFAGKKIRIAFRHKLEQSVMSFLAIDDVLVKTDEPDGVDLVIPDGLEVVEMEYFNMQGMKVEPSAEGVYIRRVRYSDGSTQSAKIKVRK